MTCGDTQIDAGNLRATLNKLQKRDQSGMTELDLQFAVSVAASALLWTALLLSPLQILNQVTLNPNDAKVTVARKNPKKNRSTEFLPGTSRLCWLWSSTILNYVCILQLTDGELF